MLVDLVDHEALAQVHGLIQVHECAVVIHGLGIVVLGRVDGISGGRPWCR